MCDLMLVRQIPLLRCIPSLSSPFTLERLTQQQQSCLPPSVSSHHIFFFSSLRSLSGLKSSLSFDFFVVSLTLTKYEEKIINQKSKRVCVFLGRRNFSPNFTANDLDSHTTFCLLQSQVNKALFFRVPNPVFSSGRYSFGLA